MSAVVVGGRKGGVGQWEEVDLVEGMKERKERDKLEINIVM